ncbi:hypothetical protein [Sulfurimonas sp.]|uniref:hypothetical protein n=1 Tax=Sulfurimonas sp. TaxID=2022749 RepID=UPI003562C527
MKIKRNLFSIMLPYYKYILFLKIHRAKVLIFFIVLFILSLASINKQGFSYADKSLWINGSKEYSKLLTLKHPSHNIQKFEVDISDDGITRESIKILKDIHRDLSDKKGVYAVNSLFEQTHIFNNKVSETQSMTEIVSLLDSTNEYVVDELLENTRTYANFMDGKKIIFYLVSDAELSFSEFDIKYPFEYFQVNENSHFKDFLLFSILFVIIAVSFTIAFKSFLPTLLGVVFIFTSTLFTVVLYQIISPSSVIHISIVLLAVTVSVMDFVYIYYKWHVLQRDKSKELVLYRVIARIFLPILWTTLVSIIGIGSLVFVDSQILNAIGLNVVLSSLVGFILSFTLLPVMLDFFEQANPQLITKDTSKYIANKESHYKKRVLNVFLIMNVFILLYGLFAYINKPMNVASDKSDTHIQIALSEKGITPDSLLEIQNIQSLLKENFKEHLRYESAYTEIKKLYTQEYPGTRFDVDNIDIASYIFMFELYGVTDSIMTNEHPIINIYLDSADLKTQVLQFIRNENILIQDHSSLLHMAKIDSINTLFGVVFFVLFLIMSIIYYMTKTTQFMFISLIVNVIPLSLFYAAVMFLEIPLSTEILVSMIITASLSSDATMHFIDYYYRNRLKPRTSEKTIETSFLYVGTPLGMGNIILILTFTALIFVPDSTVSNIGVYSSILVTISLVVDLVILPVLFLNMIKNNKLVKGYYH